MDAIITEAQEKETEVSQVCVFVFASPLSFFVVFVRVSAWSFFQSVLDQGKTTTRCGRVLKGIGAERMTRLKEISL